jgi:hypothetical protein
MSTRGASAAAAAASTGGGGPPTVPNPRIGGGNDSTAWTGGPNQVANRLSRPSSTMARRPTDFKSANTIEHIATKGLPEERHIGPDEKTSKITLTSWVNSTRSYMEERGLDTVFYVYDAQTDSEIYLLTDWGSASPAKIETWVSTLRAGVPKTDGTLSPPCDYDLDNLKWSGKAILNSISLPLWETVEKDLGVDASGPEAFAAVVYKLQQVSSAAVRTLVDELKALSLLKEPGQDVEIFGGRVVELCRRISGTGSAPADLVVLAAATFLECDVLSFKLKAIKIHDDVDEDSRAMTWDSVVRTLKTKYQSLKGQGLWTPQATSKKKDDELSGLHAAILKLSAKVASGSSEQGGAEGVRCYGCGELGHLSRDCPKARSSGARTPPKDGDPQVRTVDGASQSWCSICRRWTTGKKEHPTSKHVRRDRASPETAAEAASPAPAPAPATAVGGMAASGVEPYHGGSLQLQLHGGLLGMGQLVEESDTSAIESTIEDPSLCHDDFFHLTEGPVEETELPMVLGSIGLYTVSAAPSEMEAFLTRVAISRRVTGHDVASWVNAVMGKLADIGVNTVQAAVADVNEINPRLFRAGHIPMFTRTLVLLAQEGAAFAPDNDVSHDLTLFLQAIAGDKNLTGKDVLSWAEKVRSKLQSIGITTVLEMLSRSPTLNRELRAAGLSSMHRQTIELMTQKGASIIFNPPVTQAEPTVVTAILPNPTVSAGAAGPPPPSRLMGQCLACDGFGMVQTLCVTCKESGLAYESIEGEEGACPDCNASGPPGQPCTLAQCKEEGTLYLKRRTEAEISASGEGKCPSCDDTGPSGEPCSYCKEHGVTYLNFLAGL